MVEVSEAVGRDRAILVLTARHVQESALQAEQAPPGRDEPAGPKTCTTRRKPAARP
jgi:hypothetical protein